MAITKTFTIHLVTRGARPTTAEDYAVQSFRERLHGEVAHTLRRLTVHVEESVDLARAEPKAVWVCRVKVGLAPALDEPPFVVETHAAHAREAIDLAVDAIEGAVKRVLLLSTMTGHRRPPAEGAMQKRVSLHRYKKVERAGQPHARGERGEHGERGKPFERSSLTAHPPRGRHFHMTRVQSAATTEREEPVVSDTGERPPRPSRKSTRRSANRSKRDSNQARQVKRAVRSAEARASRAQAG